MPDGARSRTVISDTSPLFYLRQIGELQILRELYGTISVPRQVVDELQAGGITSRELRSHRWIQHKKIDIPTTLRMIPDLGPGECGVIALGLHTTGDALLLLDDRLARRIADLNGLTLTGTAGILLKAKERGIIGSVRSYLEKLIHNGFYLHENHLHMIHKLSGEETDDE